MKRHMMVDCRPFWWAEMDEHDLPSGAKFFLAHLRFARFTPRTYREFKKFWALFNANFKHPLFAYNGENGGDTWVNFVTKIGFKPTGTLHESGEELFVHLPDLTNDLVNPKHYDQHESV